MLVRRNDAPSQVIWLSASGTVLAPDIEVAIGLASDAGGSNPAGVIVVVADDFDGYFVEIARGLREASLARKSLVRLAVVTDADRLDEARLSGLDDSIAAPVRLFWTADQDTALDWATGRP